MSSSWTVLSFAFILTISSNYSFSSSLFDRLIFSSDFIKKPFQVAWNASHHETASPSPVSTSTTTLVSPDVWRFPRCIPLWQPQERPKRLHHLWLQFRTYTRNHIHSKRSSRLLEPKPHRKLRTCQISYTLNININTYTQNIHI